MRSVLFLSRPVAAFDAVNTNCKCLGYSMARAVRHALGVLVVSLAANMILVALSAQAQAPQQRHPLPGLISDFAERYNTTAAKMNASTRFAKIECSGKVVCRYNAGRAVQVMATTTAENAANTESITLIFMGQRKEEMLDLVLHIGVLMGLYAPNASQDERAVTLKTMFEGLNSKAKENDVVLHGKRFTLTNTQGMGLWVIVSDARNK